MDEVRLGEKPILRQPGRDEFSTRELREGDVAIHHLLPSAQYAMDFKHQGHPRSLNVRPSIATVPDSSPQAVLKTLFTDTSIPIKPGLGASKPVVVQCLHNRNSGVPTSRINRRRNHHEGIVDMDQPGLLLMNQFGNLLSRVRRPDHVFGEPQPAQSRSLSNLPVAAMVGHYMMPGAFQKLALLIKHDILSSRLLVGVVNEEDLHLEEIR